MWQIAADALSIIKSVFEKKGTRKPNVADYKLINELNDTFTMPVQNKVLSNVGNKPVSGRQ